MAEMIVQREAPGTISSVKPDCDIVVSDDLGLVADEGVPGDDKAKGLKPGMSLQTTRAMGPTDDSAGGRYESK